MFSLKSVITPLLKRLRALQNVGRCGEIVRPEVANDDKEPVLPLHNGKTHTRTHSDCEQHSRDSPSTRQTKSQDGGGEVDLKSHPQLKRYWYLIAVWKGGFRFKSLILSRSAAMQGRSHTQDYLKHSTQWVYEIKSRRRNL